MRPLWECQSTLCDMTERPFLNRLALRNRTGRTLILPIVTWLLLVGAVLCASTGCATGTGPRVVGHERHLYNQIVSRTEDEQLLSNIVRLRYNDTPHFLDMGSVVVQYGLEQRGNAGVQFGLSGFFSGAAADDAGGAISGGMTFTERPTVSYTPLQGEAYARRLLSSIPLEIIWLLSNSGWSVERLFILCVERLNDIENAVTASGPPPESAPTFEEFQRIAELARSLQQHRALSLKVVEGPGEPGGLQLIMRLRRTGEQGTDQQIRELAERLGYDEDVERIELSASRPDQADLFTLMRTRSLLGVLYFISHSVDPPREHIERGIVRVTRDHSGEPFDWNRVTGRVMNIQSSDRRPATAYVAVRYRGYWFYIDDRDHDSKATFGLLQLLFSLQSTTGDGPVPLLTIPTG